MFQPYIYPDGRVRPKDASQIIGLSVKTLAQMRCDGTGPDYIKIRGRVYYLFADVMEWLQGHQKQVSTAQVRLGGKG